MTEAASAVSDRFIERICDRLLTRFDKALSEKIRPVLKFIEEREEYDLVIKHGLEGYKERVKRSITTGQRFDPITWIAGILQKEPELRFPHRKILEYLSRQYDYEKKAFKEVNYSTIVRECRLGRNQAKGYFKLLEQKGLLARRTDGYRVWFHARFEWQNEQIKPAVSRK